MRNESMTALADPDGSQAHESTIGDMAAKFGVSLRTLRFYEDKGLLFPRRRGTARFYSPKDRIRLELILKGKRLGFSLSEIHALIASRGSDEPRGEVSDLVVSLNDSQVAAQIAILERQRDELTAAIEELRQVHRRVCESAEYAS